MDFQAQTTAGIFVGSRIHLEQRKASFPALLTNFPLPFPHPLDIV